MESESKAQLCERERAMAKALSMSVFFRPEYFHDTVRILENYKNGKMIEAEATKAFASVCASAGVDPNEQQWLWEYLKNCNKELAMKTDAKWLPCEGYGAYW